MSSLIFLVPLALLLGGVSLAAFLWSLRTGQYDDLEGAAERILLDEEDDSIVHGSSSSTGRAKDHQPEGSGQN
ncbi:MAG TPA: cbb3-type cytochrome oxidase assembly protein CcoS [Mycoplana sp.]|nr:cbb3-type cytochrome oxidase assembly protein CcoS [Mycoplana sp.]